MAIEVLVQDQYAATRNIGYTQPRNSIPATKLHRRVCATTPSTKFSRRLCPYRISRRAFLPFCIPRAGFRTAASQDGDSSPAARLSTASWTAAAIAFAHFGTARQPRIERPKVAAAASAALTDCAACDRYDHDRWVLPSGIGMCKRVVADVVVQIGGTLTGSLVTNLPNCGW